MVCIQTEPGGCGVLSGCGISAGIQSQDELRCPHRVLIRRYREREVLDVREAGQAEEPGVDSPADSCCVKMCEVI